jgi:hypothetical protein
MLRDAAGEAGKVVQTVANAPRRLAYRFKASKDGLALIDDPREAAAAMLVAMALARGGDDMSEAQTDLFHKGVHRAFAFSRPESEDLLAQALFIHRSIGDPHLILTKLSGLIAQSANLTAEEKSDFFAMLTDMSECEGNPTRQQIALLQIYQSKAGLFS